MRYRILRAVDIQSSWQWHWQLLDESGSIVEQFSPRIDPLSREWMAYLDLSGYLDRAPYRTPEYQDLVIQEIGDWLGRELLGQIGINLAKSAPITIYLEAGSPAASDAARNILYGPLHIARVLDRPLFSHGVSFIVATAPNAIHHRVHSGLIRILAVFSMPAGSPALDLRAERLQMRRFFRSIADQGFALEWRFVQFGATHEAFEEVLAAEEWDIVHFSGHGLSTHLIFESSNESARAYLSVDRIVQALAKTQRRLKCVILSACSSAASLIRETRTSIGLDSDEPLKKRASPPVAAERVFSLADTIAQKLACAVVAMRFTVSDNFAIDLTHAFYRNLFEGRRSLSEALTAAINELFPQGRHAGYSPLSAATPVVFGCPAPGLTFELSLAISHRELPHQSKLGVRFPEPPEHLVGRVSELTIACASLETESRFTGVLFYGMAGAGKSSCARELIWVYEELPRFERMLYFRAPAAGCDPELSLTHFALELTRVFPELPFLASYSEPAKYHDALSALSRQLEQRSALLILDNLESLLENESSFDGTANWLSSPWADLWQALHSHKGSSRVISTSRFLPQGVTSDTCTALPIRKIALHALRLDEALLFARQLPNLGRLLQGNESDRAQAGEFLRLAQGHPKLICLGDRQAADSARFSGLLKWAAGEGGSTSGKLSAFFENGESTLLEREFHSTLKMWATRIANSLERSALLLLEILCCFEEVDRQNQVLVPIWPHILAEIGEPGSASFQNALRTLQESGMIAIQVGKAPEGHDLEFYDVHASVVEAIGPTVTELRRLVFVTNAAEFFQHLFHRAIDDERAGRRGSHLMIAGAGKRAAPYLTKISAWDDLSTILERVVQRDPSQESVHTVIPYLRKAAEATVGTAKNANDIGILGTALTLVGHTAEAEPLLRGAFAQSKAKSDFRALSAACANLVNLLNLRGRYKEALQVLDEADRIAAQADLGLLQVLSVRAQRLQVLLNLGRAAEVLKILEQLLEEIANYENGPHSPEHQSLIFWNVFESILESGRMAAAQLRDWPQMLKFNSKVLKARKSRNANRLDIAKTLVNDYRPLIELGRLKEVEILLSQCRATFEEDSFWQGLAIVHSAFAQLSMHRGHRSSALEHEHLALRYCYITLDPKDCALVHFNLATYLRGSRNGIAHRLASCAILLAVGSATVESSIFELTQDLKAVQEDGLFPANFDQLVLSVEVDGGVGFGSLFDRLPKDKASSREEVLNTITSMLGCVSPS